MPVIIDIGFCRAVIQSPDSDTERADLLLVYSVMEWHAGYVPVESVKELSV